MFCGNIIINRNHKSRSFSNETVQSYTFVHHNSSEKSGQEA